MTTRSLNTPRPSPPGGAGQIALILGVVAIALMFVPVVGEFVTIPAAIGAVIAGVIGFDRYDRGLASSRWDAVLGACLGVLVLLTTLVLLAAVHGTGSQ